MTFDVYVCECNQEFAVMDGEEPNRCPFCYSAHIEFSHEVNQEINIEVCE